MVPTCAKVLNVSCTNGSAYPSAQSGRSTSTRPRKQRRHERKVAAERERRRRNGAKPRPLGVLSARQQQPWLTAGVSRRTWYRRRAAERCGTAAWPASSPQYAVHEWCRTCRNGSALLDDMRSASHARHDRKHRRSIPLSPSTCRREPVTAEPRYRPFASRDHEMVWSGARRAEAAKAAGMTVIRYEPR